MEPRTTPRPRATAWRGLRGILLVAAAAIPFAGSSAKAQERDITTSAFVILEEGATLADRSTVTIGLRRGVRGVEGVRFVHPIEVLDASYNEEVQEAVDQLDAVADMLRTGDPVSAYRRADEVVELFEAHLRDVPRSSLVDAHLMAAIARCRAGRNDECREQIRAIVAFREGLEYDADRYGPEDANVFQTQYARAISGPRGVLVVETEPPGAEVYVDGQSYGPSPARAEGLLVGRHYVTLRDVGHREANVAVELRPGGETVHRQDLEPNEAARRVLNLRDAVIPELGEQRAGPNIRSLASSLGTTQVIVCQVAPISDLQMSLRMFLYHVHTRLLQAEASATLARGMAGIDEARALAISLYDGVNLRGGIAAPEDDTVIHERPPELYEQWWFWVSVVGGAAVLSAAIGGGVAAGSGSGVPAGIIRFSGDF